MTQSEHAPFASRQGEKAFVASTILTAKAGVRLIVDFKNIKVAARLSAVAPEVLE